MSAAARAAAAFHDLYGRRPDGVWSAPGRVNLIGEHTDYNDGFVLPIALPQRTAVAVEGRNDGMLRLATTSPEGALDQCEPVAIDALAPGSPAGWAAYPAGVAWVLARAGFAGISASIVIASDVPIGAGLSSSAALECAVALALLSTAGFDPCAPSGPSHAEIARWAQQSENEFVGAPTGVLDQTASLCCREGHALFFDVRSGEREQVPFQPADAGVELLVIETRSQHAHSESEYGQRRAGCEHAARILGVPALRELTPQDLVHALAQLPEQLQPLVRHVVTENERVLRTVGHLRSGELNSVGSLLVDSHTSLRDDYRVSSPGLDLAVETALESGAVGARMTGGGFGGCAIALMPSGSRAEAERTITAAFERQSLPRPRMFEVHPAAGAGRDQ